MDGSDSDVKVKGASQFSEFGMWSALVLQTVMNVD